MPGPPSRTCMVCRYQTDKRFTPNAIIYEQFHGVIPTFSHFPTPHIHNTPHLAIFQPPPVHKNSKAYESLGTIYYQ